MWATNVPYWVALQFATAKMGAILLTVNTNYREHEIRYLLTQSECENLFIIDGFRDHDYVQTIYNMVPELKTQPRGQLRCPSLPLAAPRCRPGRAATRGAAFMVALAQRVVHLPRRRGGRARGSRG